jgi:hypothetical protein
MKAPHFTNKLSLSLSQKKFKLRERILKMACSQWFQKENESI